jgi:hypothetical protein
MFGYDLNGSPVEQSVQIASLTNLSCQCAADRQSLTGKHVAMHKAPYNNLTFLVCYLRSVATHFYIIWITVKSGAS